MVHRYNPDHFFEKLFILAHLSLGPATKNRRLFWEDSDRHALGDAEEYLPCLENSVSARLLELAISYRSLLDTLRSEEARSGVWIWELDKKPLDVDNQASSRLEMMDDENKRTSATLRDGCNKIIHAQDFFIILKSLDEGREIQYFDQQNIYISSWTDVWVRTSGVKSKKSWVCCFSIAGFCESMYEAVSIFDENTVWNRLYRGSGVEW
jgi:hypothetical protein